MYVSQPSTHSMNQDIRRVWDEGVLCLYDGRDGMNVCLINASHYKFLTSLVRWREVKITGLQGKMVIMRVWCLSSIVQAKWIGVIIVMWLTRKRSWGAKTLHTHTPCWKVLGILTFPSGLFIRPGELNCWDRIAPDHINHSWPTWKFMLCICVLQWR